MSLPRSTNASFSPKRFWNEWFACRFVEIHAVQTAARTRLLSQRVKRGERRESQQAHPSSWTPANPRSGIRVDRIPARALTVAVIKGNHRPLLDRSLAGHARARVHPMERLYCVIVFRVFRDDFCNVRFVSRLWMDLAPDRARISFTIS